MRTIVYTFSNTAEYRGDVRAYVEEITADTLISTVLSTCPGATDLFESYGLGCGSCLAASMEPLSAVASSHDVDLDRLLSELNALGPDECAPRE